MSDKRASRIFVRVFSGIGIGLLLVALGIYFYRGQIIKTAAEAIGTIVGTEYEGANGSNNYSQEGTDVLYEVNGKMYTDHLQYESSSFYVGKEIMVYYKTEEPQHLLPTYEMALFALVLAIVGAPFLVLGVIFMATRNAREKKKELLKQEGRVIYVPVTRIVQNTSVALNRRHPYVIVCQYRNPKDAKAYTFKSHNIWYDPTPYIGALTDMPIYVKDGNYQYYYMDTDKYLPRNEK